MKICFFTDTFYPVVGGAENVLHHLAVQMTRAGHKVCVLAPHDKNRCGPDRFPYPVMRYGHPSSKRFLVRQTLVHLIWIYWRYGFDLLHCHAAYPQAYVGATFKAWFKTPLAVRPHGSDIVPGGRMRQNRRIERRLQRALIDADALIAQGEYIRTLLLDLGNPSRKIHTIHNGTDLARFGHGEPYCHPRPFILAVGSLIHRKGFDLLIRAFKLASPPDTDLLIAGQGREEAALRALSSSSGLEDRVHFLGLVRGQKKVDLYRSARFVVCPSRNEPFSNVIIETMASGTAVLASDVGGNIELVRPGVTGLLFPSGDVGALAEKISQMINHASRTAKMGADARVSVGEFDWAVVAQRYLELYSQIRRQRS